MPSQSHDPNQSARTIGKLAFWVPLGVVLGILAGLPIGGILAAIFGPASLVPMVVVCAIIGGLGGVKYTTDHLGR
ncbi:hypothetical protein ACIBCN_19445 [Nocardia sp. NPDC051052]|uniref:hypothetical protein n=1 Tax=Nocardia sp. NPDC051052 TaxID=3364322 RepID=UPI0037B1EA3D